MRSKLVTLKVAVREVVVEVRGTTPLLQHRLGFRGRRKPQEKESFRDACWPLPSGRGYGVPRAAFKLAIVRAASLAGISPSLIRGGISVIGNDLVPLRGPNGYVQPVPNKLTCRVGRAEKVITIWRGRFAKGWHATLRLLVTNDIKMSTVKDLVAKAGTLVGVGEGRPEQPMPTNYGCFRVVSIKEGKEF